MENEKLKDKFLNWVGENWEKQQTKLRKFCSDKRYEFDEDIFSDTVVKVAEKILANGITDSTPNGFDGYFFKAFKQNTLRNKQYARVARRDYNVDDINALWEDYCNANMQTEEEKVKKDLKQDFTILYLSNVLLDNFGNELTHVYLEKYYYGLTYKQLSEKYKIPRLRDKLLEMKRFLKDNVTKREIENAFSIKYKNIY